MENIYNTHRNYEILMNTQICRYKSPTCVRPVWQQHLCWRKKGKTTGLWWPRECENPKLPVVLIGIVEPLNSSQNKKGFCRIQVLGEWKGRLQYVQYWLHDVGECNNNRWYWTSMNPKAYGHYQLKLAPRQNINYTKEKILEVQLRLGRTGTIEA